MMQGNMMQDSMMEFVELLIEATADVNLPVDAACCRATTARARGVCRALGFPYGQGPTWEATTSCCKLILEPGRLPERELEKRG